MIQYIIPLIKVNRIILPAIPPNTIVLLRDFKNYFTKILYALSKRKGIMLRFANSFFFRYSDRHFN